MSWIDDQKLFDRIVAIESRLDALEAKPSTPQQPSREELGRMLHDCENEVIHVRRTWEACCDEDKDFTIRTAERFAAKLEEMREPAGWHNGCDVLIASWRERAEKAEARIAELEPLAEIGRVAIQRSPTACVFCISLWSRGKHSDDCPIGAYLRAHPQPANEGGAG